MSTLTGWKFPDVIQDRVSAAFDGVDAELVHTNLSEADEQTLREAFLEDD